MKKSKAIKLVLVTGLLGSGGAAFGNGIHKTSLSTHLITTNNGKIFAGNIIARKGYFNPADTAHGPTIIAAHGITHHGFGFWGAHSAAS